MLATTKQLEESAQTPEPTSQKLKGIREKLAIAEAEKERLSNQLEHSRAELASVGEQLAKAKASCSDFWAESERLKGEALDQAKELEVRRAEIKQAKDELVVHRENLEAAARRRRSEEEKHDAKLAAAEKTLEKVKEVLALQTAAETALQSTEAAVELKLRRLEELNQMIALLETVIAEKQARVAREDQTAPAQPAAEKKGAEEEAPKASLEEELSRLGFNIGHASKKSS